MEKHNMKTFITFDWAQTELEGLKLKNLYRKLRIIDELKGTKAKIQGREINLFCGNDYLGLSQHPELIKAFQETAFKWGVGTGSARLISGTSHFHDTLEKRIAQFLRKEKALLFSSGYLANLGVLSTLADSNDLIVIDKLCHASLIDAAHLSRANLRVYPHKNLNYLENILKKSKARRNWIVTDSIFSMDGDLAPLTELVELKKRYGAYLIIDEAHATGLFGEKGRGVSEYFGVSDDIDIHIGTLSKAIGTFGGFVAASNELIDYLINQARPFIFETALPAALCAASIKAFDLIEKNNDLRTRFSHRVEKLRTRLKEIGVPALEGVSAIVPIVLNDEKRTLEVAERLLQEGFLIPAVRYPTVPKGKARLRITVSAAHSEDEIERLVLTIKRLIA